MFNPKDIEKAIYYAQHLHIPDDFGDADDGIESLDVDYLARDLVNAGCPSFHLFHGVSKAVIEIEELPFVIKIPFNGMWYYDWEKDDGESNIFSDFYYACESDPSNYCQDELEQTQLIKETRYDQIVPEMQFLVEVCGRPVYIQEKVKPFEEGVGLSKPSKNSMEVAKSFSRTYKIADPKWLAAIVEFYGEDYWPKFCSWVWSSGNEILEDLHKGNYGYRYDGTPVIFDISGFRD